MGKRTLPEGLTCRKIMITATVRDIERWDRRAAEERKRGNRHFASRSGAIRSDALAARRLHHDLRGSLHALSMLEYGLRAGTVPAAMAAEQIRLTVKRMLGLVNEEG